MTVPVCASVAPRWSTLLWWVVGAAVVALCAPLPDGWALAVQVAALLFAVFALCIVRDRPSRLLAALVVTVLGAVVGLQITAQIAAMSLEQSFGDDAVVVR